MLWERQKVNKNTTNMFRTSSPFIHQWFILNKEHFTITMSHNTFTLWTWWGKHGLWVLWVRGENNPPPPVSTGGVFSPKQQWPITAACVSSALSFPTRPVTRPRAAARKHQNQAGGAVSTYLRVSGSCYQHAGDSQTFWETWDVWIHSVNR